MFKQKFGLRLDLGYNKFNEGKNNLPFKSNYYRTTLEGVLNARNLLKFSSWTNRFNLLFHRGSNVGFIRELLNSEYINVLFNTT
jgi:OOP family OmpA-OmpF porin